MKKLLLFILPFFLCTISNAQAVLPVSESSDRSLDKNDDFLLMQQYDLIWDYSDAIWEHNRFTTHTYNDFNKPTEKFESWTDGSGPTRKTDCFYDINQNLEEERAYEYTDSMWVNSIKTLYYYDGNNTLIQKIRQVWNDEQFENEIKDTYGYNANNQKVYEMMYYWEDSDWSESQQFDFQYDENDNLYKIVSQALIEDEWVNYSKSLYAYDTSFNLLSIVSSQWDSETGGWADPFYRQIYTYDLDNNRIIFIIQYWNDYDESWENQYKTTYYYMPVGNESVEYKKSGINKTIEDIQTIEDDIVIDRGREDKVLTGVEVLIDSVIHTSDGDLEFTLSHNGISQKIIYKAGGEGDNFFRTKLSDQGVDSIVKGMAPFYGIYKPENPLSVFLETDPTGTWTLSIYDGAEGNTGSLQSWGLNLVYSSSSGVDKLDSNIPDIWVFPNPASDKISLLSPVLSQQSTITTIYDLNGKKLHEKHIPAGSENVQFDVNGLQNGMYLVKLQFENQSITKKLIIQK